MNHTIKTVLVKNLDDCEYLCYLDDDCVRKDIEIYCHVLSASIARICAYCLLNTYIIRARVARDIKSIQTKVHLPLCMYVF